MALSKEEQSEFQALVELMARLRAPEGCPWDREQSHETLKPYLIEEAYEVIEAIDGGDDEQLCDELGDLLLQVVFHAQLAAERGAFSIDDVVAALKAKLVRRHPHVFGDVEVSGSAEVVSNWASLKRRERADKAQAAGSAERPSSLDGVPRGMPALIRAHRLSQRASTIGLDWPSAAAVKAKVEEEFRELGEAGDKDSVATELGDLLFALSSYARTLGLRGETLLHASLDRFQLRVRAVEEILEKQGQHAEKLSADALEEVWQLAKRLVG